jgi:hypothetical protein
MLALCFSLCKRIVGIAGRIDFMPKKPAKPKPGPKPETLKISGPWKAAVKTALQKKKPATGWPKPK